MDPGDAGEARDGQPAADLPKGLPHDRTAQQEDWVYNKTH